MKAGRELDTLIAEKVMGWKSQVDYFLFNDIIFQKEPFTKSFHPSTEITDAWLVVEKFKDKAMFCVCSRSNNLYECSIGYKGALAETAPLAICLAALKVCGVVYETE